MSTLEFKKSYFGTLYDGTEVHLFTVSNGKMSFSVTDYGCTITSILVPSKSGKLVDVVLGYSTLDGYTTGDKFFGAVVGRFANRIGNAKFSLNGVEYALDKNDGPNCLHGGFSTVYHKNVWKAEEVKTDKCVGVEFSRLSCDGEQGMPGNVELKVVYMLSENNELTLDYYASTDKATPVNLTNHSYFNLNGYDSGLILDHDFQIDSSAFLEVNDALIPNGTLASVDKLAAFDFRKTKKFGKDIKDAGFGYDHAFCIDSFDGSLKKFAVLTGDKSGISMEVSTTLPACQVYTANFIEGEKGKHGFVHHKHGGVCLETEGYPDAPNHDDFPTCIVTPEKPYHEVTVYKFGF